MTFDRIEAVLFDMDETLIHNTRSFESIARETYDLYSTELEPATFDEYWNTLWGKAADMWFMMIDGVLPGEEARRYTFINTLRALDADPDLAPRLIEHTDTCMLEATRVLQDTIPVLSRLRDAGLRLGIVTNGYSCIQRMKIDRHNLHGLVDFTIVSEEVGAHKPEPEIFKAACVKAACAPERVLFVGDTVENDYIGARRAGLEAILIDHDCTREDYPIESGRYIRRLNELLPMLGLK
jgi:putative hydrolase of the HAD superfamily